MARYVIQYQPITAPVLVPSAAPYDPSGLEWMSSGSYPRVPVELRRIGDFQIPDVADLPTPPQPAEPAKVGGDDRIRRRWRKSPHRGFDLEEWRVRAREESRLDETIRRTWARINGDEAPAEAVEEAREIAAPYLRPSRDAEDRPRVDVRALKRDIDTVAMLMELRSRLDAWQRAVREEEEEDEAVIQFLLES